MPVMCNIQMPKGKSQQAIEKTMVDISNILMENFHLEPNQVRVIVDELPKNRYIVGGVMTSEMLDFDEIDDQE